MADSIGSRLKRAWNVFTNKNPESEYKVEEQGYYYRPDRPRLVRGGERSIIATLYNRIALDVSVIDIKHVRLDENNRYTEDIDSDLNNCLTVEANLDQTARAFKQDIVLSMFDEGYIAVVPTDADTDPFKTTAYDIRKMRTAKIVQWYPSSIKVSVYNEKTGKREERLYPKSISVILENPFYAVMNEPNSVLQRLIRKLSLLDFVDEESSAGKLDLIIQLPYIVKSENRKKQAEERRADIERQLKGSKYGIAYTDGTEHIQQLNRPLENNLLKQIEYLTEQLYSQLGMTPEILNGSANEETMLNYQNRTIEPIIAAITDEMNRKWLSKTARTRHQAIKYFSDPFKLVPVSQVAEMADKFTRNEIMTSNEFRQVIGLKPADDPKADMLVNSNINQGTDFMNQMMGAEQQLAGQESEEDIEGQLAQLDENDAQLDELERMLDQYGK